MVYNTLTFLFVDNIVGNVTFLCVCESTGGGGGRTTFAPLEKSTVRDHCVRIKVLPIHMLDQSRVSLSCQSLSSSPFLIASENEINISVT